MRFLLTQEVPVPQWFLAFVCLAYMLLISSAWGCEVAFDCGHGSARINNKSYPIVCGRQTGRGIDGGEVGHLIRADGPWRPGLVRPGTPMLTTAPPLCYDCFIHVSNTSRRFSNGCLGTTSAAFQALKHCSGSKFSIR
jgi:hypothetical protein